ncbi:MAG: Y-family DNA polymerase, partial [Cyanobacteria bacterium]|nr:Y-family DNA polymerase [Cyanobacteriota bacterium]
MKRPVFALADCNNFYASCERVFNPSLINQPIVILSNNDGCIIARSNEAKALGIKMGEPVYLARHTILRHKVHVFSANFTLYGDLSHRVMETLKAFAPAQEVYSIDEAFLDLSSFAGFPPEQLKQYGETIRSTVYRRTKITVSIGIAETKTLAKLAAELAKKSPKAQGVLNLTHSKHQDLALAKTPVDLVWGVGRQFADKLKRNNIHTALDLRHAEDKWILKHFGVVLMRTVMELRGISCIPLTQTPPPKKTIMTSRSFGYPIQTLRELKQAVATYTARTGEKLREEKLFANQIEVFIKTNRFRP